MNEDDEQEGPPPEEARPAPVEVPLTALSEAALAGVIEGFILREGTDYGEQETPHRLKVEQVRRQLERGEIVIVYDLTQQSVTLMTRREWRALSAPRTAVDES